MTGQSTPPERPTGASAQAISKHYDVSDEFFKLWLGPEMIYSCARFDGAQNLADAQLRKLDYHIEAAAAAGAARVLDIGCGWGGLLERLVAQAGVKAAVRLTLSPSQAAWAWRWPVGRKSCSFPVNPHKGGKCKCRRQSPAG